MVRPAPVDWVAYRRVRWHARLASAGFVLVTLWLTYVLLRLAGGDRRAEAMIPFVLLCIEVPTAFLVLRRMWRRSYAARPVVLDVDAGPGAVRGVPEIDEPPGHHRGLSGEIEPPTRW